MKTSFNILCVVLVVSFVGKTWPAMAQCAFGNSPNGELTFNFAESGYNTEGAAVSFTPLENISLASVSVWITGYVGTDYNGQQDMTLPGGIYSDNLVQTGPDTYLNEPGDLVVNLRTPSLNSDSTTELTYMNSSPSTIILQAKTQYWFLIYASGANTGNGGMWVGGNIPTGDAVYDGSESFFSGSFAPSTEVPSLSVNAVPEPAFGAITGLLSFLSLVSHNNRKRR
ncbi:MAG TPA: hypothetical protein VGI03_06975 [Verrucomicrobiae bacterium]